MHMMFSKSISISSSFSGRGKENSSWGRVVLVEVREVVMMWIEGRNGGGIAGAASGL